MRRLRNLLKWKTVYLYRRIEIYIYIYIYKYIHKSQCKLQIYKAEELTASLTFLNITLPKNVVHQTFLLLELIMYYYRVYFSLSRIKKKLFYRKVRPMFFFVNTLNLGDKVISFM